MKTVPRGGLRCALAFTSIFYFSSLPPVLAEDGADAAALGILDTGRKAYNEGKFDVAAERFREFLKANAQKKEAPAAQYGLALALLEFPQRDDGAIIAALQSVVAQQNAPERPYALFYLGSVQRRQGMQSADQAIAKPAEAANHKAAAAKLFEEALKNFDAAGSELAKIAKPAEKGVSPEQEWMHRCRCEQSDVLLRLNKEKEAAELAKKLIDDPALAASPLRELSLYQLGCALFALKEHRGAGRALSQTAPFEQDFGLHARYLLSRIHHLSGEYPEAGAGYKALFANYEANKKFAAEAMKNPAAHKPADRARYETLLKPPPEFISRSVFYQALLLAEAGEYGEALNGFNAYVTQFQNHPLIDEAKLRLGYCMVQLKNFGEAAKVLQPLQGHAQLGDRAMWWLAKAQLGLADPNNAQVFEQAAKGAIDLLAKAAEKAAALGPSDAEAKTRRADILLELGDTQQLAKQYKEAAATYEKVVAENGTSERAEEATERQITALHLGKAFNESEALCQKFEKTWPRSTLLGSVWFRSAENACLEAMAAASDAKAAENRASWEKQFDEAISRYKRLLEKHPEFAYVNLARYGMATALFQREKYNEAYTSLRVILDADRNGPLAGVNYLLADCLIRQFPAETNDAIQAAKLLDRAEQAARLLEKYVSSSPKSQTTAEAMLKLAYAYQRTGALLIDQNERQKTLQQARQIYEKIMHDYNNTPPMATAVLERAHCIALMGDVGSAMNEYNRFNGDPLKQNLVAPLALVRLSSLMRTQNRHNDAVNLMTECRNRYESVLQKDPQRSGWIAQIHLEHAQALKDAGKLSEARAIFDTAAKQFEKQPEGAEAFWRAAQCRREESQAALNAAFAIQKKPGAKPEDIAAATKSVDESVSGLRQTAESLRAKTGTGELSEGQSRMLYESAWCYRTLAMAELEAVRQKTAGKILEKVLENLKKALPNQPPPPLGAPDIEVSDIPQQPAEKAAQEQYAVLAARGTPTLATRARLELAEMQAQRGQNDAAIELLASALEDNPPRELAERIHLRLAVCLIAKNDAATALQRTQTVLKNAQSPNLGEAVYLSGEAHIQKKDWPNAINQLVAFRDKDPFRNMNVLTERGLMRLGFAFAQAQRWDESRQALETLVQRFGNSPLVPEARLMIGSALLAANQHDHAYNNFAEVTKRTAGEFAARAQLGMGKCRMAQKRWADAIKDLMLVPVYENSEASAEALCEAGQAHLELKQNDEAKKVLETVVKDYAASKWAETAKKRLAGTK
ncbi:MAG TPA: tetratricopeptide repeat protein [Planctomycetota bacterium]|nr:tetratricopeptide repeat protein [Planctomycetota bacterium]